ncbi:unnamed protein product [Sphagnum compactum]|jgi:inner membrane organizing system protein 1
MAHAVERPAPSQLDQKWDASIDVTLRKLVYGSLAGATTALLLFRSPTTRWAAVAFGAGVGLGSAYTDISHIFNGAIIPPRVPAASSSVQHTASEDEH